MRSFTAGQIPNALAHQLVELLQRDCCGDPAWKFYPGVSYRNLLIYRARGQEAPFTNQTITYPPHDITDQAVDAFLPQGPGAELLRELMERSAELFSHSPENRSRDEQGDPIATQIWLWGLGQAPALQPFAERFGKTVAVITAVDLVRGMARLLGWKVVEVAGATGYIDTDFAAKGRAAIEWLGRADLVIVHVEATDEASHEGDAGAKVKAVERIDAEIAGPLLEYLRQQGPYRILVCPDHPTFLRTKTHGHGFVPWAMCGQGIEADAAKTYDEISAAHSSMVFEQGYQLMPYFLGQTTRAVRPR